MKKNYYEYHVSNVLLRRTMELLTIEPRSQAEIAAILDISTSTVCRIFHRLRDMGYIDYKSGKIGTLIVKMPFGVIK